jgi:uncharacterized protein
MPDHHRIEFRTYDGVTLRGDFFPASGVERPVVVMAQGLTLLKEHYIDDIARRFQAAGVSALVYDHRGYGSSEGAVRHETNPLQQAEDYHDAVTAAARQPGVDPNRVAIWGIGHSGGASMIAAGDDPRVKAVVLNMPAIAGSFDAAGFAPGLMERAWSAREAAAQNAHPGSTYLKCWPDSRPNALGEDGEPSVLGGEAAYEFISGALVRSSAAKTPWENKLSLQSIYHLAAAEPRAHYHKIAPRHVLYMAAEVDPLTAPLHEHRDVFDSGDKHNAQFAIVEPDHLATYFGEPFEASVAVQLKFLTSVL